MSVPCDKIILSSKSYLSIIAETYSYFNIETGGIFLGKEINNIWYVLENIDPGYKRTIRQNAYFEYDQEYVNHLANIRNRLYYSDIKLIGLWHKHPGSFDSFSQTDDGTNKRFAELHSNGAISALINVDPDFRITMYHVSNPLNYQRIDNILIGDSYIPDKYKKLKNPKDYIKSVNQKIETTNKKKYFQ